MIRLLRRPPYCLTTQEIGDLTMQQIADILTPNEDGEVYSADEWQRSGRSLPAPPSLG